MDAALVWNPAQFRGDLSVTSGDLAIGNDLETAVLISLFTDRIASPDYVPPAGSPADRRGWWGDTYEAQLNYSPIGSRLWQLNRAVKSDPKALLNQARDMCNEALQWLLDDQIASSVTVNVTWLASQALGIAVTIIGPSGDQQGFAYSWAWKGL
jgi:phage gp46-like protein